MKNLVQKIAPYFFIVFFAWVIRLTIVFIILQNNLSESLSIYNGIGLFLFTFFVPLSLSLTIVYFLFKIQNFKKFILIGVGIMAVIEILIYTSIFVFFALYLDSHKAESEVEKSETAVSGEQETTEAGVTINKFDHLSGTYVSEKSDPPTSELLFETYGATATKGTFKDIEISATFDGTEQASISVIIDVASIYTAESTRDSHLKGEEFFNIAEFAKISYQSKSVIKGGSGYIAKGDITFMGASKSLDLPFTYVGSATGKENTEVFEGTFEFNPTIYGMESDAGDKVTISFYTELKKQN